MLRRTVCLLYLPKSLFFSKPDDDNKLDASAQATTEDGWLLLMFMYSTCQLYAIIITFLPRPLQGCIIIIINESDAVALKNYKRLCVVVVAVIINLPPI